MSKIRCKWQQVSTFSHHFYFNLEIVFQRYSQNFNFIFVISTLILTWPKLLPPSKMAPILPILSTLAPMNDHKPCDFSTQTWVQAGRHTTAQKGLAAPSYEPASSDVPHPLFRPFICPLVILSCGDIRLQLCSGPGRAVDQVRGDKKGVWRRGYSQKLSGLFVLQPVKSDEV